MTADEPWVANERDRFRVLFDDDVDAYDRTRPVAPDHVLDELVALAGLERGSTVVEIGPGTGQLTRPLAERGLHVVALEIGPRLAARARENLASYPDVAVLTTSFEAWDPGGGSYNAVVACNSFHWLDPDVRFDKVAGVLRPGGHLAVLSTPWVVPADADRFWWDVQDDWVAAGSGRLDPATLDPARVADVGPAVRASGRFEEPTIRRHLFTVAFSADDYAANLSTQSGVKDLPPAAQAHLVERVRRRIVERGGTLTAHLLAVLVVARCRIDHEA